MRYVAAFDEIRDSTHAARARKSPDYGFYSWSLRNLINLSRYHEARNLFAFNPPWQPIRVHLDQKQMRNVIVGRAPRR
jgi:hypothetical protein